MTIILKIYLKIFECLILTLKTSANVRECSRMFMSRIVFNLNKYLKIFQMFPNVRKCPEMLKKYPKIQCNDFERDHHA